MWSTTCICCRSFAFCCRAQFAPSDRFGLFAPPACGEASALRLAAPWETATVLGGTTAISNVLGSAVFAPVALCPAALLPGNAGAGLLINSHLTCAGRVVNICTHSFGVRKNTWGGEDSLHKGGIVTGVERHTNLYFFITFKLLINVFNNSFAVNKGTIPAQVPQ